MFLFDGTEIRVMLDGRFVDSFWDSTPLASVERIQRDDEVDGVSGEIKGF